MHPKDQLDRLGLNPDWSDDILVASVAAYRDAKSNANVILVSQDTGPRLTCFHHGIETLQLDESVALPEELDDAERENRALQQQLQRLQNALPRLEVVFEDSDSPRHVARFKLCAHTAMDARKLVDSMEQLRKKYPKILPNHPLASSMGSILDAIIPEQIKRYNIELDGFYADADSYFRRLHDLREPRSRMISFVLEICNVGTAPADDVDARFHFPDGFRLISEDELPEEPEPPDPPEVPLGRIDQLTRTMSHTHAWMARQSSFPEIGPPSSFCIRETNSYDVTDHFVRIKHGVPAKLPKMIIVFSFRISLFNSKFEDRKEAATDTSSRKSTELVSIVRATPNRSRNHVILCMSVVYGKSQNRESL